MRRETLCVIASLLIKFPALSKAASKESTLFTHELRSWSGAVSEEEEALEPSFSFPGEGAVVVDFSEGGDAVRSVDFRVDFFRADGFRQARLGFVHC